MVFCCYDCCFKDGDVDGAPLWALIYFCLRCGDPRAALEAIKHIPWVVYFSLASFSQSVLQIMVHVFCLLRKFLTQVWKIASLEIILSIFVFFINETIKQSFSNQGANVLYCEVRHCKIHWLVIYEVLVHLLKDFDDYPLIMRYLVQHKLLELG